MNGSPGSPYRKSGLFSFYGRKLFFFVAIVAICGGAYYYLGENRYSADESPVLSNSGMSDENIQVEVKQNGNILINGKNSGKKISFLTDFDEVRLPLIDKPVSSFDQVTITLTLPGNYANDVKHEILAIHGVGSSSSFIQDDHTIVYTVSDVSTLATISIVAEIPKGLIKPSATTQIGTTIAQAKANVWLAVGITLPTCTFIFVLLFLLYESRRQRVDIPEQEITAPPMAIPPALVGVLIHQHVRPREVAATLIDLAYRGDIVILDRERGFAFGKGKFDQRLLGYEKILLTKIFRDSLSADRAEIERRINDHFYSKKISMVSAGIYALVTRLGYFKTNPQRIHAKYRLIGIGTFLAGLTGFCLNLLVFTKPQYMIFLWIGMMLAALVITFAASSIPIRTPLGQETLSNWLAFKKFLSNPEPIPFSTDLATIFQRYLPYAMVMDCEAAWAKRFAKHNFTMPAWFLTDKGSLGLEDFCLSLFPIISYVSRSLTALREPGFE